MAEQGPPGWVRAPQYRRPSLYEKVRRRIQAFGVRDTLRVASRLGLGQMRAWYWDLRHGTETRKKAYISELRLPGGCGEHAIHYEPLNTDITVLLRRLRIRHEEFTFIDLGAGKGKVVFRASDLPFRSVIGVELSPILIEIGRRNVLRYRNPQQKCKNIEMTLADVGRYAFPRDPLVLFTAHSFDDVVMKQVVVNLRESLLQAPRHVYFIYGHPVFRGVLDQSGFLTAIDDRGRWVTYKGDLDRLAAHRDPDAGIHLGAPGC